MLSYFFSSRLITSENMHSAGQPSVPVVVLTNPSFGDSLSTPPHSRRNSISTTGRAGNDRRDSSSSSDSLNDAAICSPTTSSVMAAARKQRDGRRGRRVGPAVIIVDEDGNRQSDRLALPRNEEWWIPLQGKKSWPKTVNPAITSGCRMGEDGIPRAQPLTDGQLAKLKKAGAKIPG